MAGCGTRISRMVGAGLAVVLAWGTQAGCRAATKPSEPGNILPLVTRSPEINGKIDADEWKEALYLGEMVSKDGKPFPKTVAWVAMDQSRLYLAIRSAEPNPEKIVLTTLPDEKDSAVWRDDNIDLFVDLGNNGRSIFHLIANTAGTYYDALLLNLRELPSAWESEAVVRCNVGKDGWEMEIAIPFVAMHHQPVKGEMIGLNIGRVRKVTGQNESASLAEGHFAFPGKFRQLLVQGPVWLGEAELVSTRRGPFVEKMGGMWEFLVTTPKAAGQRLRFSFPGAPKLDREVVIERERQFVKVPFEPNAMARECVVEYDGQKPFVSAYSAGRVGLPTRIAKTDNPLFEELLEVRPNGLSRLGSFVWPTEIQSPILRELPQRTGMVFTPDTPYEEYRKERLILLNSAERLASSAGAETLKRAAAHQVPLLVYLEYRDAGLATGAPKGISYNNPWLLDPRVREAYVNVARRWIQASKEYPNIQWLFAGDESWEVMHRNLLYFLDRQETYPEMKAISEEIRVNYGFGKYGLPESSTDTNPFRWIATYRWEIDRMLEMQQRVKALIQAEAPQMKLVSWDNINGHRPYGLRKWGKVFDVVTGQLFPTLNPRQQSFTFMTQWLSDLSQAEEVWPVAHVERYAGSFDVAETEELLSQIFRGGGTGLHLYLADTVGSREGEANPVTDRIGAPERWNVLQHTMKRLHEQPFRVRRDQADTAIFYSNTSYQGQGTGSGAALIFSNEVEWIWTVLGPQLKSAVRFVDDLALTENPGALEGYRMAYVPYAPIVDDPEYEALKAFVDAGGVLVVCDPLAFRHRSDGTERSRQDLVPPLLSVEEQAVQPVVMESNRAKLAGLGPGYPMAEEGASVLARFENGAPAVVERKIGKGRVIFWATNPCVPRLVTDDGWIRFFRQLQTSGNAIADAKVWRFRLPPTPKLERDRPEGLCLTGNYFEWRLSEVTPVANADAATGSYTLSLPDKAGNEAASQPIPFDKGRLTDRIRGAKASNKAKGADYVLTWETDQPLEVTFRFDRNVTAHQTRVFYAGALPAGSLEISGDGMEWRTVTSWEASSKGPGVHLLDLRHPAAQGAQCRLVFKPEGKMKWELVEIDLWGREP